MKPTLFSVLFLALLPCAFFLGCGNSLAARRSLTKQLMASTKEMANLLATVKDKPSAQAAAPKMLTLIERVDKLNDRLDAMDTEDGSGGTDEELVKELAGWVAEQTRLMQEEQRISQIPEASAGLGEAWQQLTGGAYEPGGVFAPGGAMNPTQGKLP